MVFIVPIENGRGELFGHGLSLCTTTPAISLLFSFQIFFVPWPKAEPARGCLLMPRGLGHGRPPWDSSVRIVSVLPSPRPSPSSWTLRSTNVPSNSSVLCLWTIQMYCPEMSGNARGYLFWFPSTVYAPFPWLSVGYLGYGQGRQWIGWELGWIPWEAVEQA